MGMLGVTMASKAAFYGVIVCWWWFVVAFWLRKRPPRVREAQRDLTSYVGLGLQAVGYFIVWYSALKHQRVSSMVTGSEWFAWVMAVVTVAIAASSAWLVNAAARRLGKQWGLAARLVDDHTLIQDGPYHFVRNPIYAGMFGMLIATGMAASHWMPLLCASVLFAAGTYIRIHVEERLLRQAFGSHFEEYARAVRALIPGIY
jgi:protein-S-isoprenylcysteine O-methyltransferase Ste14